MKILIRLIKKELMEISRSKKLFILSLVFLFVAISSPILAKLIPTIFKSIPMTPGITINIPEATWRDSIDQFVKNISQFGLISIILVFAGMIPDEKNKRTLPMIITKPMPRSTFVLAKLLSSIICIKLIFIISSVIFYLYSVSIFGNFSFLNFFYMWIWLLVFLLLILAVTVLASTIFSNQITSAGVSFLCCIIFTTVVGNIQIIADYSPAYILSNYKNLLENGELINFWPSLVLSIFLIFVLAIVSIFIFQKQEIE